MKKIGAIFVVIVLLSVLITVYLYWRHQIFHPSTNDAYIRTDIINIAPEVNGQVIMINVHNHQYVKKGRLLFVMDPTRYQIAVNQARAQYDLVLQRLKAADMLVKTAKALLVRRTAEWVDIQLQTDRILSLVKRHYLSPSAGDLAIKNRKVANAAFFAAKHQLAQAKQKRGIRGDRNAQLRCARAALEKSEIDWQHTKVFAPTSGYISHFGLSVGDQATAYQPLFALIENKVFWVEANFKETDLSRIRPGQEANITVDMYPGHRFTGKVSSISHSSSSSFSLLPPENFSGNWVKVTQRFPVKILIAPLNSHYPLRLGASSQVTIDTTISPKIVR